MDKARCSGKVGVGRRERAGRNKRHHKAQGKNETREERKYGKKESRDEEENRERSTLTVHEAVLLRDYSLMRRVDA